MAAQPIRPTYTALEIEAAMCMHEAMLDARMESTLPAVSDAFDRLGTQAMRFAALALCDYTLAVRAGLADVDAHNFAHEVVPAILETVGWDAEWFTVPTVAEGAEAVTLALAAA